MVIERIQEQIQIVFAIHPRTKSHIQTFGLSNRVAAMSNLRIIDPVGYFAFLNLMINVHFVLTDSGGMQEETTVLGIPCLTMRDTTERPETIEEGTNTLVANDTEYV